MYGDGTPRQLHVRTERLITDSIFFTIIEPSKVSIIYSSFQSWSCEREKKITISIGNILREHQSQASYKQISYMVDIFPKTVFVLGQKVQYTEVYMYKSDLLKP